MKHFALLSLDHSLISKAVLHLITSVFQLDLERVKVKIIW